MSNEVLKSTDQRNIVRVLDAVQNRLDAMTEAEFLDVLHRANPDLAAAEQQAEPSYPNVRSA